MMFVVGDIHGEITKLEALVKNILQLDSNPSFIFIGDYIDKGEDAKATLAYLHGLMQTFTCEFLTGNHEYIWKGLQENDEWAIEYLKKYGGLNTVASFHCNGLLHTKEKMLTAFPLFFEQLKPFANYRNYIMVHSGIKPQQYQVALNDIPVAELLFNRYDFISNENHYLNNKTVVFGHTGFYTPYYDGYKVGVDTAACFLEQQPLTAFNADEKYFINSSNMVSALSSINLSCRPNILRSKPWRSVQYA